jgi:glutaredoxin 1
MIEIWGRPGCIFCEKAVALCESRSLKYTYKSLGDSFTRQELIETFPTATTYPQIKINGSYVGGYSELGTYLEETNYNGTGWAL